MVPLNVVDLVEEQKKPPLLRLAFRPFFLFGSLFSVLAIFLWALIWTGNLGWQPAGNALWWHAHEMLFGFVAAIIVGFLLTAVQSWTSVPGISGKPLAVLAALWLAARLSLLAGADWLLVARLADTLFLVAAALVLARPIVRIRQWRNLLFVPILLLLAWFDWQHYVVLQSPEVLPASFRGAVYLVVFLMCFLGGRVIPFFTANGTHTPKTEPLFWLEVVAMLPLAIIVISMLLALPIAEAVLSLLWAIAAVAHLYRFLRWRFWITFSVPLLWSLHLAYAFIVLSMAMTSVLHGGWMSSATTVIHGFTVGGMGLLIIAMMARVSLGHTGRMLSPARVMTLAFALVGLCAAARFVLPLLHGDGSAVYLGLAFACWIAGYLIFALVYLPVLSTPRIDGRPG